MTKKIVMAEGEIKMAKQGNIEYMDTTVTCACGEHLQQSQQNQKFV